jgi:DNA modification methylase
MHIYNILKMAKVAETPTDKTFAWAATPGFKPYHEFFVKDAVKHPAKANAYMIKWIIENFTAPDSIILDMMAGTGLTGVMASLLGRHAILVEYEQKFVDMINGSLIQLEKSGKKRGNVVALKGDARKLGEMKEIDAIICSPPYADAKKGSPNADAIAQRFQQHQTKDWGDRTTPVRTKGFLSMSSGYGDGSNIGNLPYGKIDAIISNPPYSNPRSTKGTTAKDDYDCNRKLINPCGVGSFRGRYSNDTKNIGNMQPHTYLEAMLQVYCECFKVLKPDGLMILITKNFIRKKQVVRLDLDTIKLAEQAGFTFEDRFYRKLTNFSFWVTNYYKKYGLRVEYEDILVFRKKTSLPNGQIDVIITSPPYSTTVSSGDPEKRKQRLAKAGYNPKQYMGGNARNLELKGYTGDY